MNSSPTTNGPQPVRALIASISLLVLTTVAAVLLENMPSIWRGGFVVLAIAALVVTAADRRWHFLPSSLTRPTCLVGLSATLTFFGFAQALVAFHLIPPLFHSTAAINAGIWFLVALIVLSVEYWLHVRFGASGWRKARTKRPSIARQIAVTRVQETVPDLDAASAALELLWTHVMKRGAAERNRHAEKWLAECLTVRFMKRVTRRAEILRSCLSSGAYSDLEKNLTALFASYNLMRDVVRQFATTVETDLSLVATYKNWFTKDRAFYDAINTISQLPTFDTMASRLRRPPNTVQPTAMPALRAPPPMQDLVALRDEGAAILERISATDGENLREIVDDTKRWIDRTVEYFRSNTGDDEVAAFGGRFENHRYSGLAKGGLRSRVQTRIDNLDGLIAQYWGNTSSSRPPRRGT
jgi:hypothetical protein